MDLAVVIAACIAAIPATIAALASWSNKRHIGRSNGKGTVVQLLENNIEWQGAHQAQDLAVADDLRRSLARVQAMLRQQDANSAQVKRDLEHTNKEE